MIEPSKPARGMDILAWCDRLWQYARCTRPLAGPGIELKETSSGTFISVKPGAGGSGGSASSGPCAFGSIVPTDATPPGKAIRGGLMVCGDKNFAVPDKTFSTASNGEWLVQLKLSGIDPATDDDDEIFLPGVISASGDPEWDLKTYAAGTNYDDNDNPASPAGTGSIVVPLGRLKITGGTPIFTATGCGNITIGQCAGILNFNRA